MSSTLRRFSTLDNAISEADRRVDKSTQVPNPKWRRTPQPVTRPHFTSSIRRGSDPTTLSSNTMRSKIRRYSEDYPSPSHTNFTINVIPDDLVLKTLFLQNEWTWDVLKTITKEFLWKQLCFKHFNIDEVTCPGFTWRQTYIRAMHYIDLDKINTMVDEKWNDDHMLDASRITFQVGQKMLDYVLRAKPERPYGEASKMSAWLLLANASGLPSTMNLFGNLLDTNGGVYKYNIVKPTLVRDICIRRLRAVLGSRNTRTSAQLNALSRAEQVALVEPLLIFRLLHDYLDNLMSYVVMMYKNIEIARDTIDLNGMLTVFDFDDVLKEHIFRMYPIPSMELCYSKPVRPLIVKYRPKLYNEITRRQLVILLGNSDELYRKSKSQLYEMYSQTLPKPTRLQAFDFIRSVVRHDPTYNQITDSDEANDRYYDDIQLIRVEVDWLLNKISTARCSKIITNYVSWVWENTPQSTSDVESEVDSDSEPELD